MVKPVNIFDATDTDDDTETTPEEIVIEQFALFLVEKAKVMAANKAKFPRLPTKDYLMEEIADVLDDEEWSPDDVARLSSLFFCLLATSEET